MAGTSHKWSAGIKLNYHSHGSDGKDSAAVQETQAQSLSREDLLEKGVATHSNILTWRIPWTEEPGGPQSIGSQKVRQD